jgi:quercetin dioxygenase-like cupin family protein
MTAYRLLTFLLAALCLGGATISDAAARWPAPLPGHEATGRQLSAGQASALPAAPALLGLVRVTYAPGAGEDLDLGPFGDVAYVEDGSLTLRVDGPVAVAVTRASADGASAEEIRAGEETVLGAGDGVYLPGGVVGAIGNDGDEPAVLLVGFVGAAEAAGPPASSPAGVVQALLGLGIVGALPPAPATLALDRVSIAAGAALVDNPDDSSLRLVVAESGAVRLRYDVELSVGRGAPGAVEQVAAGTEVVLEPGASVVLPPSARGEMASADEDPATILVVRVEPAAETAPAA